MRRERDFYPTPEGLTRILLDHAPVIGGRIYEPCVGEGHIAKMLNEAKWNNNVYTCDINPACVPNYVGDSRTFWPKFPYESFDWLITNPPFNQAAEMVKMWHGKMQEGKIKLGMALLLRLSFLEPASNRADFLRNHPPDALLVCPRTSFTGDGKSDSVTCGWMIWSDRMTKKGIHVYTKQDMQRLAGE